MVDIKRLKNRIIYKFKKSVVPPSNEIKRNIIDSLRKSQNLHVLIETGTFLGETVEYFKSKFDKIYSIELAIDLANKAKAKFQNNPNITIIQGDSGVILKTLVEQISEPALFWLDGHYSSEFFVGDEFIRTARTDKDTPIEEELKYILSSNLKHAILIDDARLFNGIGDYPSFEDIRKKSKAARHNYTCFIKDDIIHIITST